MDVTEANLAVADFWQQLNPDLNITDRPFQKGSTPYELDQDMPAQIRQQMIDEGYFSLPPIVDEREIAVLRDLVINLQNNSIMPIFAAIYDEFWQTLHRLRLVLAPILGADYRLVPDFWIWHVDADASATGWGPHRDGDFVFENIRADGTPTLCTAWIALTDADTTNSTIYVLPRKHDALFQDFVRRKFGQPGIPDAQKIPLPINQIRALPAKAGAMIGWDLNLLHWGSQSSKWASGPRMSIGIYYQAQDTKIVGRPFDAKGREYIDYANEDCPLSFNDRLTIIANNMETYGKHLDDKLVQEKHYNDRFRNFRGQWKRSAHHRPA